MSAAQSIKVQGEGLSFAVTVPSNLQTITERITQALGRATFTLHSDGRILLTDALLQLRVNEAKATQLVLEVGRGNLSGVRLDLKPGLLDDLYSGQEISADKQSFYESCLVRYSSELFDKGDLDKLELLYSLVGRALAKTRTGEKILTNYTSLLLKAHPQEALELLDQADHYQSKQGKAERAAVLWECYIQLGMPQQAQEVCQEALDALGNDPEVLRAKTRLLLLRGIGRDTQGLGDAELDEVKSVVEASDHSTSVLEGSDLAYALALKGQYLLLLGRISEAKVAMRRAEDVAGGVASYPVVPRAYNQMHLAFNLGDHCSQEQESLLHRAIEGYNRHNLISNSLCLAYEMLVSLKLNRQSLDGVKELLDTAIAMKASEAPDSLHMFGLNLVLVDYSLMTKDYKTGEQRLLAAVKIFHRHSIPLENPVYPLLKRAIQIFYSMKFGVKDSPQANRLVKELEKMGRRKT
jgi:tetratricopeptide (TPR) repeat protein